MEHGNKRKKLVIVGAGIVVILIVVFAALSYFNVLPISTTFKPISKLNNTTSGNASSYKTRDGSAKLNNHEINIRAEGTRQTVLIHNGQDLIQYLEAWGIFESDFDWGVTGVKNWNIINTILVENVIDDNAIVEQRINIGSSKIYAIEGVVDVHVHLAKSILDDAKKTPEEKGKAYLVSFLTPVYKAAIANSKDDSPLPEFSSVIEELAPKNYFRIENL